MTRVGIASISSAVLLSSIVLAAAGTYHTEPSQIDDVPLLVCELGAVTQSAFPRVVTPVIDWSTIFVALSIDLRNKAGTSAGSRLRMIDKAAGSFGIDSSASRGMLRRFWA